MASDISALYQSQRLVDPGPSSDDDLDDIIINRALQMNTGFTQMEVFTGILNRVSFRARFRVMCLQDYYGAHCNTHCVDRNDDVNGHYTCNRDGSFQCLEGFENPNNNCRDMINPCDSSPCVNGSCNPMGPFDYTCQCAIGYTGHNCDTNIDDCMSAICPNNSVCVDGIDSYECVCNPDFMLNERRCVLQNQGTQIIPDVGGFTTSSASKTESGNKNASPTKLYIVAAAVALTVISLIIITVVLIVVIIKWKRKKTHHLKHQDNQAYGQFLSLKMEENPAYGQFSSLKMEFTDNQAYGQLKYSQT